MARPGDSILVNFVENEPIGKCFARRRDDWPYHVTLVPWFQVADEAALDHALEAYAQNRSGFCTEISGRTAFGAQKDIQVNLLKDASDFTTLHTDLLAAIQSAGARGYDTRWLGQLYTPHVTRHRGGKEGIELGHRFIVDKFYKVRLIEASICRVEAYYTFGANA